MNCSAIFAFIFMVIIFILFIAGMGLWGILIYAILSFPIGTWVLVITDSICRKTS